VSAGARAGAGDVAARWAAVVAHFDARGRLAMHLERTVAALQAAGARVCFVSTGLGDEGASRLRACAEVIRRPNVGYDFASYRAGLQALGLLAGPSAAVRWDRVLLLNSSIVIADPGRLLEAMRSRAGRADLTGLTFSLERQGHLQSYGLVFEGGRILGSESFQRWWQQMPVLSDRAQVIEQLELGLSLQFARTGFRLEALYRPGPEVQHRAVRRAIDAGHPALPRERGRPVAPAQAETLNPTHFCWDDLFEHLGVLKLELLARNPHRLNLQPLRRRLMEDATLCALVLDAIGAGSVQQVGRMTGG